MKKFFILAIAGFFAISLSSCSKNDADPREQYVGTYSVIENITYSYTMKIDKSSSADNEILITNFGDYGQNIIVRGILTGNSLNILSQTLTGYNNSVTGSGTFNGNVLNFSYTLTKPTGNDSFTAVATKQ